MMWLIEEVPPIVKQTPENIANRVMSVNFAAIHTSSMVRLFFFAMTPFR